MLRIIFLIVTAFLTSGLIIWVIDHEGFVVVNWLGYELKTNIITAITLSILFTATIFVISYFFIKIISIKFPHLAKILLKKSYFRNLEDLVKRHQVGFESLTELLLAMEVNDIKAINELKRITKQGGNILFVTPVGKQRIEYNAHRIYSFELVIDLFKECQLMEFSLIDDKGDLIENAQTELVKKQNYGCGCFWFKKI